MKDGYPAGKDSAPVDSGDGLMKASSSAPSSCPTEIIRKSFGRVFGHMPDGGDTTLADMDGQLSKEGSALRRVMKPKKF